MKTELINARVDVAIKLNGRAEHVIICMAVGIFSIGVALLLIGYWSQNPYVGGGSLILGGFLYWPIKEILKLRRDNLMLQILPAMVSELPRAEAAREIKKFLDRLGGR
jgi:hypothetical protein